MGQVKTNELDRPIKRAGVIRPKEPVTVYVTAKVADHSSNRYKVGDAVELHRVTAERWIKAGKAVESEKEAKSLVESAKEPQAPDVEKKPGK